MTTTKFVTGTVSVTRWLGTRRQRGCGVEGRRSPALNEARSPVTLALTPALEERRTLS
jgi:hypothetical protein